MKMKCVRASVLLLAMASAVAQAQDEVPEQVRAIHERAIVLDTHLDTPANLHRPGWSIRDSHQHDGEYSQVDLPRMKIGGLDGGFWVVYTAQGARDEAGNRKARDHGLVRLTAIREMVAANPQDFELALTAADAERISKAGKRVVFISMENASPLASDPSLLSAYQSLGLRMLGVTHTRNNDFGDSSTDPAGNEWNGLSPKGRDLVKQANRLGILLDGSHASDLVVDQLLQLSKAPIVLSHTSADAEFDHPRNLDDERIRKLAAAGGVIHVNAYGGYLIPIPKIAERETEIQALEARFGSGGTLSPAQIQELLAGQAAINAKYPVPRATFEDYMRHLLHILKVAGPKHVGIGADWDGGGGVAGLEDVAALPKITQRLLKEGYSEQEVRDIWGGNLLRILSQVEQAADTGEKSN